MSSNPLDDQALREAFASLAETSQEGCPDSDRIWAAVSGELPPQERRELVEEIASNPACAEAWRLALELWRESGGAAIVESPETSSSWRRFAPYRGTLAAAAGVVLAVGIGWFARDLLAPGPEFRNPDSAVIESLVPEDEPQSREPLVLRWDGGPPDASYDVTVMTEDLVSVSTGRGLEVMEFRVPEGVLQELPSGTILLWQVRARAPDGDETVSPTFVLELR